jgi:segregation and condensation protein A
MEKISFKLDVFEGPLELLLHLISKHKLNIKDIEISSLLTQYINYIEQMKLSDLEVASEFLEMAARLVYIKTVSLLPKSEEAEELKKELEGQLLELTSIKSVAAKLNSMFVGFDVFTTSKTLLPIDKVYTNKHSEQELIDFYSLIEKKIIRRKPPKTSEFSTIVSKRMVSVMSRIIFILRKLYNSSEIDFDEFYQTSDRSELVATFLAMLELVKSKRIVVDEQKKIVYFKRGE